MVSRTFVRMLSIGLNPIPGESIVPQGSRARQVCTTRFWVAERSYFIL
jgi:hypothetical protein